MPTLPTLPDLSLDTHLSQRRRVQAPHCVNQLLARAGFTVQYHEGMDYVPALCLLVEQLMDRLDRVEKGR